MRAFLLAAGAVLLFANSAEAQGFNCRYAKSADEVRICQDADLSRLDTVLNRRYSNARLNVGMSTARRLEQEQAIWLRARRQCGASKSCLVAAYSVRIDELSEYE